MSAPCSFGALKRQGALRVLLPGLPAARCLFTPDFYQSLLQAPRCLMVATWGGGEPRAERAPFDHVQPVITEVEPEGVERFNGLRLGAERRGQVLAKLSDARVFGT